MYIIIVYIIYNMYNVFITVHEKGGNDSGRDREREELYGKVLREKREGMNYVIILQSQKNF